jgi:hypothetical protein
MSTIIQFHFERREPSAVLTGRFAALGCALRSASAMTVG